MKSEKVINEIEKTLPQKLRVCRYCGAEAKVRVSTGRNFNGDMGFVGTVKCTGCYISVSAFGEDARSASVMARSYWERGIYEAWDI